MTRATLELSPSAFDEIKEKFEKAGYQHAIDKFGIDMNGVIVTRAEAQMLTRKTLVTLFEAAADPAGDMIDTTRAVPLDLVRKLLSL